MIDLTGQVFGRWEVIKRVENSNDGGAKWLCECRCINRTRKSIDARSLRKGHSKSCGCLKREFVAARKLDIAGQVFGRWKVLWTAAYKDSRTAWLCECQCPKKTRKIVTGKSLRNGHSTSCGCLQREVVSTRSSKPFAIDEKIISREQFAEMLGISKSALKHHLRNGKTPDEIADMVLEKRIR